MTNPDRDHGVEFEPHLRGSNFEVDASEAKAQRKIAAENSRQTSADHVEHGVWDEPALSEATSGPVPKDAATYASWLQSNIDQTTSVSSWNVTLCIALMSGPWAILGAFMNAQAGMFGVILVTVLGPLTEEVMKAAAATWVVEKRPFFFRSPLQILICLAASGFCFAVIENLIYLNVYVKDPSETLIIWRWTICVALHVGCSLVAGCGLVKVWRHSVETCSRAELSRGATLLIAAIVIHGLYNGFAVLLQFTDLF